MTFVNGTLMLNGHHLKVSLSRFEHKVQNETAFVCLEDYMLFYNAEPGKTTQNSAFPEQSRLSIVSLSVTFVFLGFVYILSSTSNI